MKLPVDCCAALEGHLKPEVFRALADPSRLALLARLASSSVPLSVTQAGECCGVHISGVSRHLALLRETGLVFRERRGREVMYQVNCEALTGMLRGLADALESCRARCEESHGRKPRVSC